MQWEGTDSLQNVRIALLTSNTPPMIELIEPVEQDNPIYKLLEKQGVGPYHTYYEVDDIEEAGKILRFIPTTPEMSAIAFGNRNIRFFYSRR